MVLHEILKKWNKEHPICIPLDCKLHRAHTALILALLFYLSRSLAAALEVHRT
jgi:hypothetical protein